MKKSIFRGVLLLIVVCIMSFSCLSAISAKAGSYKIPSPSNFVPNKAANEIEYIVGQKSVVDCEVADRKVQINGEAVVKEYNEAKAEMDGYIEALKKKGLSLNRELVSTVTVRTKNVDLSDFVEIIIDEKDVQQIKAVNNLKIVLRNKSEYIILNNENINCIAEKYGKFRMQIKEISNTYTIRFLDQEGAIIEKYKTDVEVGLPANHREQTVYLFMNNAQENWGGQYNGVERSMEFMTKYSGEYNIASPEIKISDIGELTEEEQKAIRFMVVRGYFRLSADKFSPASTLTRYDFAESLVRIFFALDNEAVCTFPDVDKKHYKYVAASQQSNIVEGFADGTFKGTEKVTVEQVIALAARTINQKNGYVYPENTDKYLEFARNKGLSDWAKKELALAVREGIYFQGMDLNFSDGITRKDAAMILYRLFMIMNNTPEATDLIEYGQGEDVVHKTIWNKTTVIIVVCIVAVIDLIAIILAAIFIRRKKQG